MSTPPIATDSDPTDSDVTDDASRWELIRDLATFQLKLVLDGARDVLLSPISLIAALIDLVLDGDGQGRRFYQVLLFGRRSERWIDLFRAADRIEPRAESTEGPVSVDALVGQVEKLLVEQVERGGVTAQAKSAIDRSLDAVTRTRPH